MRSLRGRLTLGVAAVIIVVLAVAGLLISSYTADVARDGLDDRLARTAELSSDAAVEAVTNQLPGADKRLDAVLGASDTSLRLAVGDSVLLRSGSRLVTGPVAQPGLRTVSEDGRHLRVLVVALPRAGLGSLARLEVAAGLAGLDRRQSRLDRRLLELGFGALLLISLGTLLAASRVLGPIRRLRRSARRASDASARVPEDDGPAEVRDLAASINTMLAQIERATAATRRFALDAGHELRTPLTTVQATLSALARHPDVAPEQREAMLADALEEQRRLVALLDGLQAYARGEVSPGERTDVDLGEVVLSVAAQHPGVEADVPEAPVVVRGWEPGLRLLVANLVTNAVRHGGGHVRVALAGRSLTVDDEGPGIPAADRERVFAPFERLDGAGEGSGLGLALVAQQARDHGATVEVQDAPGGGARFIVRFP